MSQPKLSHCPECNRFLTQDSEQMGCRLGKVYYTYFYECPECGEKWEEEE